MNEKEISMDYSIQSSRITPNSPTSSPSSLIPTLLLSLFLALFSKSSLSETSHRWNGTNKYILNRLFFFFGHTHTSASPLEPGQQIVHSLNVTDGLIISGEGHQYVSEADQIAASAGGIAAVKVRVSVRPCDVLVNRL